MPNRYSSILAIVLRRVENTILRRKGAAPNALLVGSGDTGAVPTAAWHIDLDAQREPDIAGGNSGGEGLISGSPAQWGEHEVAGEYTPVGLTELLFHRGAKFAQAHNIPSI